MNDGFSYGKRAAVPKAEPEPKEYFKNITSFTPLTSFSLSPTTLYMITTDEEIFLISLGCCQTCGRG